MTESFFPKTPRQTHVLRQKPCLCLEELENHLDMKVLLDTWLGWPWLNWSKPLD